MTTDTAHVAENDAAPEDGGVAAFAKAAEESAVTAEAEPRPTVTYLGVSYPLIRGTAGEELTEREKFDAERFTGQSIDQFGNYTAGLVLAFITLRRAGVMTLTFDQFIDLSEFTIAAGEPPPLPEATANGPAPSAGAGHTVSGGNQSSRTSSDSTRGT